MGEEVKVCKCGNKDCLGFILLHPHELNKLDMIKASVKKEKGDVEFDLKISPSSGEIFTTFYELHVKPTINKEV